MSRAQRVPPGKMKITVNVDEDVVQAAKIEAVRRKTTLGELIEKGLRAVLAQKGGERKPRS